MNWKKDKQQGKTQQQFYLLLQYDTQNDEQLPMVSQNNKILHGHHQGPLTRFSYLLRHTE